jgi:DNA-binding XRE family transcriptional regulator
MSDQSMKSEDYRRIRESIGSQSHVADKLGLNKMTISNRERGIYDISREAELAIMHLYNFSATGSIKMLEVMKSEVQG